MKGTALVFLIAAVSAQQMVSDDWAETDKLNLAGMKMVAEDGMVDMHENFGDDDMSSVLVQEEASADVAQIPSWVANEEDLEVFLQEEAMKGKQVVRRVTGVKETSKTAPKKAVKKKVRQLAAVGQKQKYGIYKAGEFHKHTKKQPTKKRSLQKYVKTTLATKKAKEKKKKQLAEKKVKQEKAAKHRAMKKAKERGMKRSMKKASQKRKKRKAKGAKEEKKAKAVYHKEKSQKKQTGYPFPDKKQFMSGRATLLDLTKKAASKHAEKEVEPLASAGTTELAQSLPADPETSGELGASPAPTPCPKIANDQAFSKNASPSGEILGNLGCGRKDDYTDDEAEDGESIMNPQTDMSNAPRPYRTIESLVQVPETELVQNELTAEPDEQYEIGGGDRPALHTKPAPKIAKDQPFSETAKASGEILGNLQPDIKDEWTPDEEQANNSNSIVSPTFDQEEAPPAESTDNAIKEDKPSATAILDKLSPA